MYIHLDRIRKYPNDRELNWTEELQGVTHDDDYWFITQKDRLWRIPVSHDLNADVRENDPEKDVISVPIPPELSDDYDHYGDLDYFDGHLFVALEHTESKSNARIACFDADTLAFVDSELLPLQATKAPWCAVNRADNLIYSSRFDEVGDIFAYEFSVDDGEFQLSHHHTLQLREGNGNDFQINGIQGGVFTTINERNVLLIASNADSTRGINVIEVATGKCIYRAGVGSDFWTAGEEIEGITVWDLDNGAAPGIEGQVHLLELDNDVFESDDLKSFYHYRIIESEFVANKSPDKLEVHQWDCVWVNFINQENKVPFDRLDSALESGYDGCFYCLKEHHTR